MQSIIRKSNLMLLLTLVLLLIAGVAAAGAQNPAYNDYARFIAGLSKRQSALATYENQPVWPQYAGFISASWERFEQKHLAPMRDWAAQELGPAKPATVFYPFSGPDFVNMYTLFPHAKTYLMIALEPVGEMPDFSALDENRFFGQLERSLYDLLQLNFFITEKLNHSLAEPELKGILPVLLFFLGRADAQIKDVRYWVMQPDGTIEASPAAGSRALDRNDVAGVRIDFARAGSQETQTLYYFRFNLRNDSLAHHEKFVAFLKGFGPFTTFAKAASYLMHKPNYSGIRQLILHQSRYILESDSAIPLKFFDRAAWNLKIFGTYTSPIDYFKKYQQQDLAELYQQGADVYPLPFGIDYRHRVNTSNLMFASKKVTLAAGDSK